MELLKKMYAICSPSNDENEIKAFIRKQIQHLPLSIEEDEYGNLFITKGTAENYPCIAAHLDEVHIPTERIIHEEEGRIFATDNDFQPTGCGADDKNGIWIALQLLECCSALKVALFICEERGCVGAHNCDLRWFDNVRYVIECDRKGNSDFIINGRGQELCDSSFIPETILTEFNYFPSNGYTTDVVVLRERGLSVPCCNLSCGYHNPHSEDEYTNIADLHNCLLMVKKIIHTL